MSAPASIGCWFIALFALAGCAGERVRVDDLAGDWAVLVWEDRAYPRLEEWNDGHGVMRTTSEASASFVGDQLIVTLRTVYREGSAVETTTTEVRGTIRRRVGSRVELAMIPRDGDPPHALNCAQWEPGQLTCFHPEGSWQYLTLLSRETP